MSFEPRLDKPRDNSFWGKNPYWTTVENGGYNRCIPVWSGVMPNCVGYAYGRFMEAGKVTSCNLSTHNARLWYGASDGYERGTTPKLGAVICYDYPSDPSQAGHVGIVEKINSDGTIIISESGYQSTSWFFTHTLNPPFYYYPSSRNYKFQGFIYNPYVKDTTKVEDFVKKAKSKINRSFPGKSGNKHNCSADFVVYCAEEVGGLLGIIIPETNNPSEFVTKGINSKMGYYVSSSKRHAQVGDIILIRDVSSNKPENYVCDDIGIVIEISEDSVKAVIAESVKSVRQREYAYNSKSCYGFFRPDWSKVDNNSSWVTGYGTLGKFYDTENTDEDATIREVAYLSDKLKISTNKSKIRVSVVNYTTVMSAIMDELIVPMKVSTDNVILDGIDNQNARIIIRQLINKGLNTAAAVGICANIKHESGYNPSAIEIGKTLDTGGAGLCQWTGTRNKQMRDSVGENWRNNITGQIDFLWYELQTYPIYDLSSLQTVPDTENGAKQAADIFVRKFERPANVDKTSLARQRSAAELWNQIIIQLDSSENNSKGVLNTDPIEGTVVEIPTWLNQSGITKNYTNYSYFFHKWKKGTIQRQLADKWAEKGKPSNRGIAVLDGYYLCATTLIFGTTGDKISIILEDYTAINAIIADSKGQDPSKSGESGNIYGHSFGNGKIDVIEWERTGSAISAGKPDPIDISGWEGKRVLKIINGGKYQI